MHMQTGGQRRSGERVDSESGKWAYDRAGVFMGRYSVPNGDLKWKLLNFIL